jgi:hypothetical protein
MAFLECQGLYYNEVAVVEAKPCLTGHLTPPATRPPRRILEDASYHQRVFPRPRHHQALTEWLRFLWQVGRSPLRRRCQLDSPRLQGPEAPPPTSSQAPGPETRGVGDPYYLDKELPSCMPTINGELGWHIYTCAYTYLPGQVLRHAVLNHLMERRGVVLLQSSRDG